jgi:pantoate--beta-alanine ligase
VLYRALSAGAAAAGGGPAAVLAAAQAVLNGPATPDEPSPLVDYLALADAGSYAPVREDDPAFRGTAVLAIAARVGPTRLIDNVLVEFGHAADD